jgi:hypothetical protein
MIPQLSLIFKDQKINRCEISESAKLNKIVLTNLTFLYSFKSLLYLSIGWIGFNVYYYFKYLIHRPGELFIQRVWFGELLLPQKPSPLLFTLICLIAISIILIVLYGKDKWYIRLILAMMIMWINLVRWSCGGESVTSNIFMLSHFLSVFIPVNEIKSSIRSFSIYNSIVYFYLGIFITYFFSGLWKSVGLIYKILLKPEDLNWLDSKAALYTSLVGYHMSDLKIPHVVQNLLEFPLFWQVSFLITCVILISCPWASSRLYLRPVIGLFLIVFHTINNIAFDVQHYMSSFTLLVLFFPYHRVFVSTSKDLVSVASRYLTYTDGEAYYEKKYSNGDKDVYRGFYAYRQNWVDDKKIWSGILYFPFIESIGSLLVRKKNK